MGPEQLEDGFIFPQPFMGTYKKSGGVFRLQGIGCRKHCRIYWVFAPVTKPTSGFGV